MTTQEKLRKGFEKETGNILSRWDESSDTIEYYSAESKWLKDIIAEIIPYMKHNKDCDLRSEKDTSIFPHTRKCTCGLDDLKKRIGL